MAHPPACRPTGPLERTLDKTAPVHTSRGRPRPAAVNRRGLPMIRYALRCDNGHDFDSWFQSSEAFDALQHRRALHCPDCDSTAVGKAPMAPRVAVGTEAPAPRDRRQAVLAALRRHVEENSDYVGEDFAAEARAIHEGRAPDRLIHGEANPEEARALIADGVPVAPLPFVPARKVN